MKQNLDPNTGLKERTVNIASILKLSKVSGWGKPKGVNIFDRI